MNQGSVNTSARQLGAVADKNLSTFNSVLAELVNINTTLDDLESTTGRLVGITLPADDMKNRPDVPQPVTPLLDNLDATATRARVRVQRILDTLSKRV